MDKLSNMFVRPNRQIYKRSDLGTALPMQALRSLWWGIKNSNVFGTISLSLWDRKLSNALCSVTFPKHNSLS